MKDYLISRLREASTYRGIVLLLSAVGVHLSGEGQDAILTIGVGVAGLLGAIFPDGGVSE